MSPCQVDDDGCEDESGEEHDGLEAAVSKEGARHAEHQVEAAYRRWKIEMHCKLAECHHEGLTQYPTLTAFA